MPRIFVEGLGWVTFPGEMSQEQIRTAIRSRLPDTEPPSEGLIKQVARSILSPVGPVERTAASIGQFISPREEAPPRETALEGLTALGEQFKESPFKTSARTIGELTQIPTLLRAFKDAPETPEDVREHPVATLMNLATGSQSGFMGPQPFSVMMRERGPEALRELLAGSVESLGRATPLDMALLLAGLKGRGRLPGSGKIKAGERAAARAEAKRSRTRAGLSQSEGLTTQPRLMYGSKEINPTRRSVEELAARGKDPTPVGINTALDDSIREVIERLERRRKPVSTTLPPSVLPPKPKTQGLKVNPDTGVLESIPDVGGALGIEEASQGAADLARRNLRARQLNRSREIDRLAAAELEAARRRGMQEAREFRADPNVPSTVVAAEYEQGRTPFEAASAATLRKAEQTAQARAVNVSPQGKGRGGTTAGQTGRAAGVGGIGTPTAAGAVGALVIKRQQRHSYLSGLRNPTAAQAAELEELTKAIGSGVTPSNLPPIPMPSTPTPTPPLPKTRPSTAPPPVTLPSAATTKPAVGSLKISIARDKLLTNLKREANKKGQSPGLSRDITRFHYLAGLGKQTPEQLAELARLVVKIQADENLSPNILRQWQRLDVNAQEALERSAAAAAIAETGSIVKPESPVARAVAAAKNEPSTVARSEAVAKEITPPVEPTPVPPAASVEAAVEILSEEFSPESIAPLAGQIRRSSDGPPIKSSLDELVTPVVAEEVVERLPITSRTGGPLQKALEELSVITKTDAVSHPETGLSRFAGAPPPETRISLPGYARGKLESLRGMSMRRSTEVASARRRFTAARTPFRKVEPVVEAPAVRSLEEIASVKPETAVTARKTTALERKAAAKQELEMRRAKPTEGIGPPPAGVDPPLWAHINAVEIESQGLMAQGITDARLIDQLRKFYGAEEAAYRSGLIPERIAVKSPQSRTAAEKALIKEKIEEVRVISGGKGRQTLQAMLAENDARFRRLIDDPRGFMRTEALVAGGGALAGGFAGAAMDGENLEDIVAGGIGGAIVGGFAGWAGARGLRRMGEASKVRGAGSKLINTIELVDTANLLAGPAMIKSSFGSLGGVSAGLAQRVLEGNNAATRSGLQYIRGEMVKDYFRHLTAPIDQLGQVGLYTNNISNQLGLHVPPTNFVAKASKQVLRPFIASDRAGGEALRRMGFSREEASRLMMIGTPTSVFGKKVLELVNASFLGRMLVKFPRVRIMGMERAVEYTPGAYNLAKKIGYDVRGARGAEQLTRAAIKARGKIGGAAIAAGTIYGYTDDPSLLKGGIVASAAGPAFVPTAMGIAAGKALKAGTNPLLQALASAATSVPQIQEADILQLPQRLVPFRPARRFFEQFSE